MNKERVLKTTGIHQLSENDWMKEFRVSSQYSDQLIYELVLRDETILQKRSVDRSEVSDFVRHLKFKSQ